MSHADCGVVNVREACLSLYKSPYLVLENVGEVLRPLFFMYYFR